MEAVAVATQQEQNENPYVAVLSKKIRNLKKKYDRVVQLEAQLKEGKKTLNEEQTILVASRPSLGKALAEIESIKKQLEEVAEKEKTSASPATTSKVEEPTTTQQQPTEMIDSSTFTQEVELVANSTQCEQETNPAPASNTATVSSNALFSGPEVLRAHLEKILKLFHVCSRYTVLSGNPLPADINYFGKCLLGETSIDCFSKTLNQSVRNAELYLDEDLGSQYEAIRGMSYSQIAEIIDSLAAELPVPTAPAPPRAPTPPTQSPQINFFADGGGVADASDNSKFQDPIGTFAPSSSPFPLPPSAVVMYDQWNPSSEPSAPLSPSTLAASALGGVIGSTGTEPQPSTESFSEPPATVESSEEQPAKDNGGRRGRGQSRGRGKGRGGRGRGKDAVAQGEGEVKSSPTESQPNAEGAQSSEPAAPTKAISWGGQQKKLSLPAGATEVAVPTATAEKEAGRSSGKGRGRGGRGASGRGGSQGAQSSPVTDGAAAAAAAAGPSSSEGRREGGQGRGSSRGRGGRGSSRGGVGGRTGSGNAKPPSTTTPQA